MTRKAPGLKTRFFVGIDPGINTGYAVYDAHLKEIVKMETTTFWSVFDLIETHYPFNTVIVIETPKKTRLYARQDGLEGHRQREKVAANAGGNAREAELLADGLELSGYTVLRITPTRHKLDAKEFARITKITKQTNQHVRDAVMLVFGR